MLNLPTNMKIFLCASPVDLRKSFDGLSGLVESVFQSNVLDGHLFLFINKRRDRIKALWWDHDGLVLWYKRLERGSFEAPRAASNQSHHTLDVRLFIGSLKAGSRAATLLTIVSTAVRNDLDVWAYVKDVLDQLLAGCTNYESLRADVWRQAHPEAVRTYRVEERRDQADRQRYQRARRRLLHRSRQKSS